MIKGVGNSGKGCRDKGYPSVTNSKIGIEVVDDLREHVIESAKCLKIHQRS